MLKIIFVDVFQAKKVQDVFGSVDIIVNNAGIVFGSSVVDSDPADVERTFNVNTLGQVWVSEWCVV